MAAETDSAPAALVRVWDPFVRLFHWSLATSFLVAFLTRHGGGDLHHWAGYAAAALVVARLLWGVLGTRFARFSQFVRSPAVVLRYLRDVATGREARYLGHNPAGGAMIVALLVVMLATATTGYLQTTDQFFGDEGVQALHELLGNGLLLLVLAHLAGVALASLRHRENLVLAMITGRKRAPLPDAWYECCLPFSEACMSRLKTHEERHAVARIGWLRAAVLGANDGIVSTASLLVGVAAASADKGPVLVAGLAGLVAGALSMAAGEYVSVSSQSDSDRADLIREKGELAANPELEREELTQIYVDRGLDEPLARQVAAQLMAKDALGAHLRDELGISTLTSARPIQAALTSAATFSTGAAVPVLAALLLPTSAVVAGVVVVSLVLLGILGALGAWVGQASVLRPTLRVLAWGALAMAITSAVGRLFGASG